MTSWKQCDWAQDECWKPSSRWRFLHQKSYGQAVLRRRGMDGWEENANSQHSRWLSRQNSSQLYRAQQCSHRLCSARFPLVPIPKKWPTSDVLSRETGLSRLLGLRWAALECVLGIQVQLGMISVSKRRMFFGLFQALLRYSTVYFLHLFTVGFLWCPQGRSKSQHFRFVNVTVRLSSQDAAVGTCSHAWFELQSSADLFGLSFYDLD